MENEAADLWRIVRQQVQCRKSGVEQRENQWRETEVREQRWATDKTQRTRDSRVAA